MSLPRSHHRALAQDESDRPKVHWSWRLRQNRDEFHEALRVAGVDLGHVQVAMNAWRVVPYWQMSQDERSAFLARVLANRDEVARIGRERAESVRQRYAEWLATEDPGHALAEGSVPTP